MDDPAHKKATEVAEEFAKSPNLKGMSFLHQNGIGLFLLKNRNNMYDCITELIDSANMCSETLPKEIFQMKMQAAQFIIESPVEPGVEILEHLKNNGFLVQGIETSCDDQENVVYRTVVFGQNSENWDSNFEEFLQTYPEFLDKKWKDAMAARQKPA